ncbi:MAG: hypothetical protein E6G75_13125 [Alphaproteobacteria bacterium]|nr:MAG: hypothetical protein E6G75_13125 [Alphaproteobacteria bacterium]
MLRILVVWILSALLAGCSGSSRLEPDWANAPPRRDATQYAAPKNQSRGRASLAAEQRGTPAVDPRTTPAAEPRATPAAEPQEAKKTEGQSPSEE